VEAVALVGVRAGVFRRAGLVEGLLELPDPFGEDRAELPGLALDLLDRQALEPFLVLVHLVNDRLDALELTLEPRPDHRRHQLLEHQVPVLYRPWDSMYAATASGTIPWSDAPSRMARRIPVAETGGVTTGSACAPPSPSRGITATVASRG